jgi:hypothetical protein
VSEPPNAKSRPEAALGGDRPGYFDAASIAAEAAMLADVAALMAEVAAEEAAFIAESVEGGVTTVVDGAVAAGVVVVVVVSSFLLQAANETAAARVTISNAVFMFLLNFRFRNYRSLLGTLLLEAPQSLQDKERPSISSA